VQPLPTTPRPELSPSAVVSRREHDAAVSREHERVAELERQNELLRDYIETQAAERQAVIERYERILDRRDAAEATAPRTTRSDPDPETERSSFDLRGVLSAVRSALSDPLSLIVR
jgi:hypothetical protein